MTSFKEFLFLALSTFYIVYLIVPIIGYLTGLNISLVSIATFTGLLVLYPKAFFNKVSIAGGIYLFVLLLYYLTGKILPGLGAGDNSEFMRLTIAAAFILPNYALFSVVKFLRNDKLYSYLTWMPLVTLVVSFITFTPLIIGNNEVLRQVTYSTSENYNNPILPHYSLLHAYILIVPALLLAFRFFRDKRRFFFLFVTIYTLFVIVQSSIATTIIMAVMVIVFLLMYSEKSEQKSIARASAVVIIFFLLFQVGIIGSIMDSVASFYEGTASAGKMRLLSDFLSGKELSSGNSFDERGGLHQISIDAFFAHPLIGSDKVGEHSCILDRLGGLGLVGFIPYIYFVYCLIISTARTFTTKAGKTGFFVVTACAIILLYTKGTFGQECWLFLLVLAPSILHYTESQKHTNNGISQGISHFK